MMLYKGIRMIIAKLLGEYLVNKYRIVEKLDCKAGLYYEVQTKSWGFWDTIGNFKYEGNARSRIAEHKVAEMHKDLVIYSE